MMKTLRLLALLIFLPGLAWAQSDYGLYNGQVPTAAQWNSYFAGKVDYPINCPTGTVYANVSGGVGSLGCIAIGALPGVASANRWTTARSLVLSGDATGTVSLDGSANVNLPVTLAASGATAGSYSCPVFTLNAKGLITSITNGTCSGTGTVTSVGSGTCLMGGPITSTGTLAVDLGCAPTWASLVTFGQGAVITPEATPATNEVGYLGAPRNTENANYTLVMSDAGKFIYHTNAGANTWTIPDNSSVAFPIGTTIVLCNEHGGGNVTVQTTTDTLRWTTSTGSRTLAADGTATLLKVDTTTWRLTGDGIS